MLVPLSAFFAAIAGQASHVHHDHGAPGDAHMEPAHIVVTINPEARVSAVRGRPLPAMRCGSSLPVQVHIVNQGFVTAPLRATLAGDAGTRARLHIAPDRMSGRPAETRVLHLEPLDRSPVDVTIVFSISDEIGDLAGRDRVHLFVACS